MTDSQGKIVWSVSYKAYGSLALKHVNEIENPIRFQGQYHDIETGLHYNRHRYYDPNCGQFINQDPIGLLGGLNNYQYVPNPTGWVDPLGLKCSEAKSKDSLIALQGNSGSNSHFYDRHGAQTTLEQQHTRAHTGLTPDNYQKNPVNSTRFLTHQDQLESAQKAIKMQNNFGTGTGVEVFEFDMGRNIAEGYRVQSNVIESTGTVKAVFKNGKLLTMYGNL